MATVAFTIDSNEEIIQNNEIVILDFWADWCGPCKMFGPIFEKVSDKHPDIVFAKCNTQNEQELAANYGIRSIPTIIVIRDGIVVFNQSGALPEPALEGLISKVRELDMDEIRAESN